MFFKICKSKLLTVLTDFPDTLSTMVEVAESRQRRLYHYIDPSSHLLAKEDEIDPEDCKTELFGADAEQIVSAKEEVNKSRLKHRYTHRLAAIQKRRPAVSPSKSESTRRF
jgi:hypothetical protein